MWPEWLEVHAEHEERGLFFALQRGLFSEAMADAELRVIPFNENDWSDLVAGRETVFAAMVADRCPSCGLSSVLAETDRSVPLPNSSG